MCIGDKNYIVFQTMVKYTCGRGVAGLGAGVGAGAGLPPNPSCKYKDHIFDKSSSLIMFY